MLLLSDALQNSTALREGCIAGHLDVVQLLITKGASLDIVSGQQRVDNSAHE